MTIQYVMVEALFRKRSLTMTTSRTIYGLCRERRENCSSDTSVHVFSRNVRSKLYRQLHRSHVMVEPGLSAAEEGPLGSVFNLDFSPDDSYLVTVLAARAFELYDSRVRKKVHSRRGAHDDCVNCVTFISARQFATCSDDCTIRLWDPRNLRLPLGILRGHENWVKNIEYDGASGLLFSIAFQDGVRYWDLRDLARYSSDADHGNLIQTLSDPVRMRLAPDSSKMFVTSRKSRCMVISEFDGSKLPEVQDLHREFLSDQKNQYIQEKLWNLSRNRPSVHTLCGNQGVRKHRIVMSATFHPSGDFIALRHTDVGSVNIEGQILQELTSLYDLRPDTYTPCVAPELAQQKYLRYVDDHSPEDSRDYIKEICFSGNGQVLVSPHQNGVRLLAVDPPCTPPDQYFDSRYHSPHKDFCCPDFEEVLSLPQIHSSSVLTCRSAHHDFLIASGSLTGTVAFTTPKI